jgi:hypothetical protein
MQSGCTDLLPNATDFPFVLTLGQLVKTSPISIVSFSQTIPDPQITSAFGTA